MALLDTLTSALSSWSWSTSSEPVSAPKMASSPHRMLFLIHAESGQATVHLAVIHALKTAYPDSVDLHLGSFSSFRSRSPDVTFHAIEGKSMRETGVWVDRLHDEKHHIPGLDHTASRAEILVPTLVPYTPEEYVTTAQDVERLIGHVKPDLVIIDTLFQQAIDAAWRLGVKHCLLSPNTAKDVALKELGLCAANYPMIATGLDYSIPWKTFFRNALAGIQMEQYIATQCPHAKALCAARREAGYHWPLPLPNPRPNTLTLCVSAEGFDYPMKLPSHIRQCGPILLPAKPIDAELLAWLTRGDMRTVLVAFGTHSRMDQVSVDAIYTALSAVLKARDDMQVLWKLAKHGSVQAPVSSWGDRIRIVDWLESDPVDIMRTGRIGAIIHHGGSNSYHEALATGLPQVIVSAWLDCHDFGPRAEYLGVGLWANRGAVPKMDAQELTKALMKLLCDAAFSAKMAKRARDVQVGLLAGWQAQVGDARAFEGRDVAARAIWEYASEN